MKKSIVTVIAAIVLSGCSTVIERAEPITLADALKEMVEALNQMSQMPVEKKNGLVPAEVSVTFTITAGKKEGKTASINVVPTGIIKEISGLSAGWVSEATESRGNTITIKFRSILFANEKELVAQKTPEELSELYDRLEKEGWNVKFAPGNLTR